MALTDKLTNIADAIREKTGSTRTMNLEEMAAAVTNIKIPTALSDLNEDETHRTVTDAEKKTWNDKSDFSGNYDDLKNKQLAGTTDELTPTQVYAAVSTGKPVKVQYTDRTYGALFFTAFNIAESLNVIVSQTIVYVNGVYILAELFGDKSNNVWSFMATTLAQKTDIPSALPSPNALTFTGAVEGSYDGAEPLTVEIPGGGSGSSDAWNLIEHITAEDAAISYEIPLQPGAKEYGICWEYTLPDGVPAPMRDISVDESLAEFGVMYRNMYNDNAFIRIFRAPNSIAVLGINTRYAGPRATTGGTYIGSGTDFPAMTLKTNKACTTSEIWVYWR